MTLTSFTPVASSLGGALIGAAAVMLMSVTGRIAGVSGIAARLLPPYEDREFAGRLAFVAGLVAAPLVCLIATGRLPAETIEASAAVLVLAGFLVGFGSVWGNGCTSGHCVCAGSHDYRCARSLPRSPSWQRALRPSSSRDIWVSDHGDLSAICGRTDLRFRAHAFGHVESSKGPQLSRPRRDRFRKLGSESHLRHGWWGARDFCRLPTGSCAITAVLCREISPADPA